MWILVFYCNSFIWKETQKNILIQMMHDCHGIINSFWLLTYNVSVSLAVLSLVHVNNIMICLTFLLYFSYDKQEECRSDVWKASKIYFINHSLNISFSPQKIRLVFFQIIWSIFQVRLKHWVFCKMLKKMVCLFT